MFCNLFDKFKALFLVSSVYAFLHHAAAVFVADYISAFLHHYLENELVPLLWPGLKDFLNYMVPIDIFSQESNFWFHILDQNLKVFRQPNSLYDFLDGPSSMLVSANQKRFRAKFVQNSCHMLRLAVFDYFLRQIVPERIGHKLNELGNGRLDYF